MEYIDLLSSPESGDDDTAFNPNSFRKIVNQKEGKKSKSKFGRKDFIVNTQKNSNEKLPNEIPEEKKRTKRKVGPIRYNGKK